MRYSDGDLDFVGVCCGEEGDGMWEEGEVLWFCFAVSSRLALKGDNHLGITAARENLDRMI